MAVDRDDDEEGIEVDLGPTRAVPAISLALDSADTNDVIDVPRSGAFPSLIEGNTRLGRYTLLGLLGKGGMAEVFLAKQDGPMGFAKTCVVKRIRRSLSDEPRFVEMFLREARVAARLNHPNAVQIFELGQDGKEYFLAMEFLDGVSLHRAARRSWHHGESVPMEVALRCVADAALGLHHAHTLAAPDGRKTPLVHRDVSPDNVMLTRDGVSKVLDFGIAKSTDIQEQTGTGEVKGKIPFMSPEQLRGDDLDGRSDLWSLGVTMYWLLTGKRPFDANTEPMTIDGILRRDPRRPREMNPLIPTSVENVVMQLLEKDREKRLASGAVLANTLLGLLGPSAGYAPAAAFAEKAMGWEDAEPGQPISALTVLAARPESQWLKRLDADGPSLERLYPVSTPTGAQRAISRPSFAALSGGHPQAPAVPPPETGKTITGLKTADLVGRPWIPVAAGVGAAALIAVVALVTLKSNHEEPVQPFGDELAVATTKPEPKAKPLEEKASDPVVEKLPAAPPDEKPAATHKSPAPDTRVTVLTKAPGRIQWKLNGRVLGKGKDSFKVPKGTAKLTAYDPETGGTSTVLVVDGGADFAANGTGTVVVRVKPWADVELGSKKLGTTPIDPITLPVGRYLLHFTREGINKSKDVDVKAGATATVNVDMRDAP